MITSEVFFVESEWNSNFNRRGTSDFGAGAWNMHFYWWLPLPLNCAILCTILICVIRKFGPFWVGVVFFCLKTLVFLFVYLSTLVYSLYLKKLEHISYLPFSDSFDYFGLLRGRVGWECKHLIPSRVWSGLSLATLASPAYIWI